MVAEARRLRRAKGKASRLSYREISARLKDAGYCNERGNPQSVRAMIEGYSSDSASEDHSVNYQAVVVVR